MAAGRPRGEPTHLIERPAPVRTIGRGVATLFRVGTYDVIRGLARAPGAWLVEARGPHREAVLLQLVHLRSTTAIRSVERDIARQTAELLAREELAVMAHGSAPREDDSRLVFWALPWPELAERVGNAPVYLEGQGHLVAVGAQLARRLQRRQAIGLTDPLLCEQTILIRLDGVDVLGVPVHVRSDLLAEDTAAARQAPEEEGLAGPTKSGDLWRLGHALTALSTAFETIPERLAALLERLTRADPAARPSLSEVMAELEAAQLGRGKTRVPPMPAARTPTVGAIDVSELATTRPADRRAPDPLESPTSVNTPRFDPDASEITNPQVTLPGGPPPHDASETTAPNQPVEVPSWAFFFEPSAFHRFIRLVQQDLDDRRIPFNVGTGVVQLSSREHGTVQYLGISDLARACHRAAPDQWPGLIRQDFDQLIGSTGLDAAKTIPMGTMADVLRAAGGDVVLGRAPSVARRISTTAPGTEPSNTSATFADPADRAPPRAPTVEVPVIDDREIIVDVTPIPVTTADDDDPEEPVPARPAGRGVVTLVIGLAVGIVAGAAGMWAASQANPEAGAAVEASTANEVVVDAVPAGALVISERDGLILGPVPLVLQVPPELEVAVLVTAADHEPQRIVLPSRGSVSTRLLALPPEAARCAISLPDEAAAAYEGVEADVGTEGQLVVPGAAVVRAKDRRGPRAGAWALRCPGLGGRNRVDLRRPPVVPVDVSVHGPPGAIVYLNDRNVGVVPQQRTVVGAFTKVTLRSAEQVVSRWVPTVQPVVVSLRFP